MYKNFLISVIKHSFYMTLCFSSHAYPMVVVGHRGASGLVPESTLQGYKIAIEKGVDYIDMDIAMTSDHHFVVSHDLSLNPMITRDKHDHWLKQHPELLIKQMTLKEIKQFKIGKTKPGTTYQKIFHHQNTIQDTSIPTLKEVITYAKKLNPRIRFQIEIKTDPEHPNHSFSPAFIVKHLIQELRELNVLQDTRIQAFDWRCLYEIHRLAPAVQTAFLTDRHQELLMQHADPAIAGRWTGGKLLKNYHHSIPYMIKSLGGKAWDPESHTLNRDRVNEAKALGLEIMVWSELNQVDYDQKEIKRMLKLNIDGIITDRPDKLFQDITYAKVIKP